MKLTLIPSGEFTMGSKESAEDTAAFFNKTYGEKNRLTAAFFKIEHPQHRVRITKPFYLGTYRDRQGQTLNINFPKVNIQSLTLALRPRLQGIARQTEHT